MDPKTFLKEYWKLSSKAFTTAFLSSIIIGWAIIHLFHITDTGYIFCVVLITQSVMLFVALFYWSKRL